MNQGYKLYTDSLPNSIGGINTKWDPYVDTIRIKWSQKVIPYKKEDEETLSYYELLRYLLPETIISTTDDVLSKSLKRGLWASCDWNTNNKVSCNKIITKFQCPQFQILVYCCHLSLCCCCCYIFDVLCCVFFGCDCVTFHSESFRLGEFTPLTKL